MFVRVIGASFLPCVRTGEGDGVELDCLYFAKTFDKFDLRFEIPKIEAAGGRRKLVSVDEQIP
jgi:hypothetical protein